MSDDLAPVLLEARYDEAIFRVIDSTQMTNAGKPVQIIFVARPGHDMWMAVGGGSDWDVGDALDDMVEQHEVGDMARLAALFGLPWEQCANADRAHTSQAQMTFQMTLAPPVKSLVAVLDEEWVGTLAERQRQVTVERERQRQLRANAPMN